MNERIGPAPLATTCADGHVVVVSDAVFVSLAHLTLHGLHHSVSQHGLSATTDEPVGRLSEKSGIRLVRCLHDFPDGVVVFARVRQLLAFTALIQVTRLIH